MNVSEFARYVGYSRQTIYTDINDGVLVPTTRIGIGYKFSYALGDEYMAIKRKESWEPIVISNNTHNGGVGKTFILTNLMIYLAEEGYNILGIDNDAQGHFSRYFLSKDEVPNFIWQVYQQEKVEDYMIKPSAHKNIDIISSTLEFAEKEEEIFSKRFREKILKRALDNSKELLSKYHFIFIDNHPALGVVQFNSMMASHGVVVVNDCRMLSKASPEGVMTSIEHSNSHLIGIVMNKYKAVSNETSEALKYAREKYGDKLFRTVVSEWENLSISDKLAKKYIKTNDGKEIEAPDDSEGEVVMTHPYYMGAKKDRELIVTLGKEFLSRLKQLPIKHPVYGIST